MMQIGAHVVGVDSEPFVIAELGVNHDGSVVRACELVNAAHAAGAPAIKLQYFKAGRLLSRAARLADYQRAAGGGGGGAVDAAAMLAALEMSVAEMATVVGRAQSLGLACIVTVYSCEHVRDLSAIPWQAYKIASPDIVNQPLLEAVAATGWPMIVSTGTATSDEVARAARWLARRDVAFLQCVSAYPTPIELASLGAIRDLASITGAPVGYSDHTTAIETGALAVAAGACILEKHLTYDRSAQGPDHSASLDPTQFAEYARLAHCAHLMMGGSKKQRLDIEQDVLLASRQSIVTARSLPSGHLIVPADLTIKRPGTGIEPWRLREVIGMHTTRALDADVPVTDADVAPAGRQTVQRAARRVPSPARRQETAA